MSLHYRLFVTDVDGTIMGGQHGISPETKAAVCLLKSRGVMVTLATGRNLWEAEPIVQELEIECPVILANGAQVYDYTSEKLLYGKNLDWFNVIEFLKEYVNVGILASWHDGTNWNDLPLSQFLEICELLTIKRIILELPPGLNLRSSSGSPFWAFRDGETQYEITPKSAEKGDGLEQLCTILGVQSSQTVTLGNDINDISLIERAGVGFAVGDSVDRLKRCADGVLAPLRDEPILAVTRWLLGEVSWEALVATKNCK